MRGLYMAKYLELLAEAFARKRGVAALDLGAAFDLIVGTSTGAIIACGLAAGLPLSKVVDLYLQHGSRIFPKKIPSGTLALLLDLPRRRKYLASGQVALRTALTGAFGDESLAAVYRRRKIALGLPSVEMTLHRSWVFKTPHLPGTNHRDDDYSLVDVCLASSAAPLFRSLAVVRSPDGLSYNTFVDGGLWANSPTLVALLDALAMTADGDQIHLYSVSSCPRPAGEAVLETQSDWGYFDWGFGARAAALSIDAQEFAASQMTRLLLTHLRRDCQFVRFPHDAVPAEIAQYLDLDDTRTAAQNALLNLARNDANMTNSTCNSPGSAEGRLICGLLENAPVMTTE